MSRGTIYSLIIHMGGGEAGILHLLFVKGDFQILLGTPTLYLLFSDGWFSVKRKADR